MDIRPDDCLDTCSGSEDEACSDRDADLDGESTLDGSNGDNGEQPPRKRGKISRELPPEAIAVFKNWMLSEKNFAHPVSMPTAGRGYPSTNYVFATILVLLATVPQCPGIVAYCVIVLIPTNLFVRAGASAAVRNHWVE